MGDIRSRCLRLADESDEEVREGRRTSLGLHGSPSMLHARIPADPSKSSFGAPLWPQHGCLRAASQARAVKRLLAHRLPAYDAGAAKQEWCVQAERPNCFGISQPRSPSAGVAHAVIAFRAHARAIARLMV